LPGRRAERVPAITDAELQRIGELAAYYAFSEEALELLGGCMGGTRALWGFWFLDIAAVRDR